MGMENERNGRATKGKSLIFGNKYNQLKKMLPMINIFLFLSILREMMSCFNEANYHDELT